MESGQASSCITIKIPTKKDRSGQNSVDLDHALNFRIIPAIISGCHSIHKK